jgi:hypothetical protein
MCGPDSLHLLHSIEETDQYGISQQPRIHSRQGADPERGERDWITAWLQTVTSEDSAASTMGV